MSTNDALGLGLGTAGDAVPRAPRRLPEAPLTVVWGIVVALLAVHVLHSSEHGAANDPLKQAALGKITGASPKAMIHPANFAHVLRVVGGQMKPGERVQDVRVAPTTSDVDLIDRYGNRRSLHVDLAYHTRSFSDISKETPGGIPLANLDTSAPARMLAAVRRRYRNGAVDYFYYSPAASSLGTSWSLFLTGTTVTEAKHQWEADAHGRGAHLLGAPLTRAQKLSFVPPSARRQILRAEREAACLKRARTAEATLRCGS